MLAALLESLKTKRETQAITAAEAYRVLAIATAKGKSTSVDEVEAVLVAANKSPEVFASDVAAVEKMHALQKECSTPYTVEMWRADAQKLAADDAAIEEEFEAAKKSRQQRIAANAEQRQQQIQKRDRYEAAQRELAELQYVWGDK